MVPSASNLSDKNVEAARPRRLYVVRPPELLKIPAATATAIDALKLLLHLNQELRVDP